MERSGMSEKWDLFVGDGEKRSANGNGKAWQQIPEPPSWRLRKKGAAPVFVMTPGLANAVNAALHLRRPLLITGEPGSGKSTLVDVIATELDLGTVLRWHISSKSTLNDGLYEYDALGRLHATQEQGADDAPESFITLGPLGTALAANTIRAVLIDEIDKSDLDLPGDLLNVIENAEFTIPVLARAKSTQPFTVKGTDGDTGEDGQPYTVDHDGVVRGKKYPVIVFTSNGERAFSAPFLRRCVRFEMPRLTEEDLKNIISAHLGKKATADEKRVIGEFYKKLQGNEKLAVSQILEYVFLVTGESPPKDESRKELANILLKELTGS
jgi:MoxR-like ATPase